MIKYNQFNPGGLNGTEVENDCDNTIYGNLNEFKYYHLIIILILYCQQEKCMDRKCFNAETRGFTFLYLMRKRRFPCHLDIISRLGYNNSGGRISAKMFAAPRHAADKWPGQNVCRSPICG
jgi:hypothetical protein